MEKLGTNILQNNENVSLDIDNLKKMAMEIVQEQNNNKKSALVSNKIVKNPKPKVKSKTISPKQRDGSPSKEVSDIDEIITKASDHNENLENILDKDTKSTMELFGMNIPSQTFYLLIILIIIGGIIWKVSN